MQDVESGSGFMKSNRSPAAQPPTTTFGRLIVTASMRWLVKPHYHCTLATSAEVTFQNKRLSICLVMFLHIYSSKLFYQFGSVGYGKAQHYRHLSTFFPFSEILAALSNYLALSGVVTHTLFIYRVPLPPFYVF